MRNLENMLNEAGKSQGKSKQKILVNLGLKVLTRVNKNSNLLKNIKQRKVDYLGHVNSPKQGVKEKEKRK